MAKAKFTKEDLIKEGWKELTDDMFYMEKEIPNRNPLNKTPEDTDIKLVLHGYMGQSFAVLFPDGGMLNFVANSLKDLRKFESMINFYDCPY